MIEQLTQDEILAILRFEGLVGEPSDGICRPLHPRADSVTYTARPPFIAQAAPSTEERKRANVEQYSDGCIYIRYAYLSEIGVVYGLGERWAIDLD